jgi:hypothetical protein
MGGNLPVFYEYSKEGRLSERPLFDGFDIYYPPFDVYGSPVLHTYTSCDISADVGLDCQAVGIIGSYQREWVMTNGNVHLSISSVDTSQNILVKLNLEKKEVEYKNVENFPSTQLDMYVQNEMTYIFNARYGYDKRNDVSLEMIQSKGGASAVLDIEIKGEYKAHKFVGDQLYIVSAQMKSGDDEDSDTNHILPFPLLDDSAIEGGMTNSVSNDEDSSSNVDTSDSSSIVDCMPYYPQYFDSLHVTQVNLKRLAVEERNEIQVLGNEIRLESYSKDLIMFVSDYESLTVKASILDSKKVMASDFQVLDGVRISESRTHGYLANPSKKLFGLAVDSIGGRQSLSSLAMFQVEKAELNGLALIRVDRETDSSSCQTSCVDWYGKTRVLYQSNEVFGYFADQIKMYEIKGRELRLKSELRL